MRKIIVLCLLIAAITAGTLTQVRNRIGQHLLAAGFPNAAAVILTDPGWKGIAYYAAQKWDKAADAFRHSHSPEADYNLGNALAQAKQYSAAVDAYDAALAWKPGDVDAKTNKKILEDLMSTKSDISAQGAATGFSAKDGGVANAAAGQNSNAGSDAGSAGGGADAARAKQMTALENNARVDQKADASASIPDLQWLEALPDKAGTFLKLRIEAEHERRVDAGLSPSASKEREQ
jgi:Ca-activated chloride channel family protein